MTRLFLGMTAIALLLGAPGLAQTRGGTTSPKPPPARTAPAPAKPLFSSVTPAKTTAQCQADCAKTYYFCLAENEMQDCAPAWSQCRLACNAKAR